MTCEAITRPDVKRGTIPVFATATAITVSNIYFTQPLLDEIARGFHASASTAGLVATTGQIGYALGIIAIVPLADAVRLRRLSTVLLVITAAALLAGAAAPSVALLSVVTLILSATTVLPQVIMPTVVSMATPGNAGRVLGAVGTGLTMGALLSRTAAGLITEAAGTWRAGYAVAAVATGALLLVLPRFMPTAPPAPAGTQRVISVCWLRSPSSSPRTRPSVFRSRWGRRSSRLSPPSGPHSPSTSRLPRLRWGRR